MSQTQNGRRTNELAGPAYGVIERDLAETRAVEDDYELLRLPRARSLTPTNVPDECYLRFGSRQAPRVDLRDYVGQRFEVLSEGKQFGAVYLQNPAGTSGTLTLFHGVEVGVEASPEIGEIGTITGTVTVTDDGNLDAAVTGSVNVPELQNQENLSYGVDTVGTPGTAQRLNGGSNQVVPDGFAVLVQGEVASSGDVVYVGDSSVSSTDGYPLADGQTAQLAVDDVATLYVDADTADDGVRWIVEVA